MDLSGIFNRDPHINPFHEALQTGIQNYSDITKAAYQPMTLKANAAAKMTYANLMGPQFVAKLMQNKNFWDTLTEDQRKYLQQGEVNTANSWGTATPGGAPQGGQGGQGNPEPSPAPAPISNTTPTNTPTQGGPLQGLRNWLDSGRKQATETQSNLNNMPPKESGGLSIPRLSQEDNLSALKLKEIDPNSQTGKGFLAYRNSPQFYAESQREGMYVDHPDDFYSNYYDQLQSGRANAQPAQPAQPAAPQKTSAEKVGEYEGIVKEGEELGKDRANSIKELDKTYESSLKSEIPMKEISKIATNPEFVKMRDRIPFFQDKQMWYLSKQGTKEQQELIGEFKNYANQVVASTVTNFGGRILDKEITLAQNMKVSDNDTMGELIGKLKAAELINEVNKRGSRIASDLMRTQHISKGQALEQAYKQIDGDKIKEQINYNLMPVANGSDIKATIAANPHMTEAQVKEKLKKKGYRLEIQLMGEQ